MLFATQLEEVGSHASCRGTIRTDTFVCWSKLVRLACEANKKRPSSQTRYLSLDPWLFLGCLLSDTPRTSAVRTNCSLFIYYHVCFFFGFLFLKDASRYTVHLFGFIQMFSSWPECGFSWCVVKTVTPNPRQNVPLFTVNSDFTKSCWLAVETEHCEPPIITDIVKIISGDFTGRAIILLLF